MTDEEEQEIAFQKELDDSPLSGPPQSVKCGGSGSGLAIAIMLGGMALIILKLFSW